MLRRAGKDQPEVFTTRWAMSYLRGPMTRDQIQRVTGAAGPAAAPAPAAEQEAPASAAVPAAAAAPAASAPAAATPIDPDVTPVMPEVGGGVAVRWVDPAAPWLAEVGGDAASATTLPAVVARVALRYDEAKADLVHDEEYEAVLFPLGEHVDVTTAVAVDYDDRDLRDAAPADGAPTGSPTRRSPRRRSGSRCSATSSTT